MADEGTTPTDADDDDESATFAEHGREAQHQRVLAFIDDGDTATMPDRAVEAPGSQLEGVPDIAIAAEPSHVGDTQRIRAGAVGVQPALPFRERVPNRAGAALPPPPGTAGSPSDPRIEPEIPEAVTGPMKARAALQPALPFVPIAVEESPPASQPAPASSAAPSCSAWVRSAELDPSSLPSSQLGELGVAVLGEGEPSRAEAKRSALPPVLLLLALVLGFVGTALVLHC